MTTVALDIGDTGLEAASVDHGVVALVRDSVRGVPQRLPACVGIDDGIAWVGHAALDRPGEAPRIRVVAGLSRALGQPDPVLTDPAQRHWQAEGLMGLLIRKLLDDHLLATPSASPSAVVAVPSDASEAWLRSVRSACRLAGFSAVVTVDQAIAHAAALNSHSGDLMLLADAGSGPATLSLVRRDASGFALLHTVRGERPLRELVHAVAPAPVRAALGPTLEAGCHDVTPAAVWLHGAWAGLYGDAGPRAHASWLPDPRDASVRYPVLVSAHEAQAMAVVVGQELARLLARMAPVVAGAGLLAHCSISGQWGRNPVVLAVLNRERSGTERFMSGPPATQAWGAARWHAMGLSGLLDASDAMVGIRTVNPADGQPMIQPLIPAGTALPALGTFPLFANRTGQKRLVIELARVDDDGLDHSLGFFAFEFDEALPLDLQLDVSVRIGQDQSVTAEATDRRNGRVVEAVLGSDDIDSVEAFMRHRAWLRGLGVNAARGAA